jgi:HEAT repeat protein
MNHRLIVGVSLALALAGFGMAESKRREATDLRAQLERLTQCEAARAAVQPALPPPASAGPRAAPAGPAAADAAAPPSADPWLLMRALADAREDAQRERIMEQLLRNPSALAQAAGIVELLKRSPEEGVQAVRELVSSLDPNAPVESWGAAEVALLALSEVEGTRASAALYEYAESAERMLRIPAARGLELRGDAGPVRELVQELNRDLRSGDAATRIQAITDLGRTRSPESIAPLAAALADANPDLRRRAAQSLGQIETLDSAALLQRAAQDPAPGVRLAASNALERLELRLQMRGE